MKKIEVSLIAEMLGVESLSRELVSQVAVDTRLLEKGDLFFALEGERVDGHQFLQDAAERGAVAAVVNQNFVGDSFALPLIRVENTLKALQTLAKEIHKEVFCDTIALTGSHGKTTTKNFIASLLRRQYNVAASPKSYNGQIGLPLSILNFSGDEEILVQEMGMNHKGELDILLDIVPPDIALLLNVEKAHASHFDSLKEIAEEKVKVLCNPKSRLAIIGRDVPFFEELVEKITIPIKTFGMKPVEADYTMSFEGEDIEIFYQGKKVCSTKFHLPADFNKKNCLAAVAVAHEIGLSWEEIALGVPLLQSSPRRFQLIEKDGICFVDDSYNAASVASLCQVLKNLPQPAEGGRKIAVLGYMAELPDSVEGHQAAAKVALENVDTLLCYGEECQPMVELWRKKGRPALFFSRQEDLIATLRNTLKVNDVVLVKGSRSSAMENVIDELLKQPMLV